MIKRTPADAAFSDCVRQRSNWTCERCGGKPIDLRGLHCAHVMSRGHWSVRFDPSNALALCYGCHRITEQRREVELIPLVKRTFGEAEWDRVFADAMKVDRAVRKAVSAIAKHYRAEFSRMAAMRRDGNEGRIEFDNWRAAKQ